MHTVQLELDDTLYNDIVKKGIDIQAVLKDTLKKALYPKEHKIAQDIKEALDEVKLYEDGKIELQDAKSMLKELRSVC